MIILSIGLGICYVLIFSILSLTEINAQKNIQDSEKGEGLSLWIDKKQVRQLSGFEMEIFVISNGNVMAYILDPDFEKNLPCIPSDVNSVNFTWKAGGHKYYYTFFELQSFNTEILNNPVISVASDGKIPRSKTKVFSVYLLCTGNATGIATFGIGLQIKNRKGKVLPGMPLHLRLQKHCVVNGPDPECDKKCSNGGKCNQDKKCECPEGYLGQHCNIALCFPPCINGGNCIAPGVCNCSYGYQGPQCEGGICREKCLNGGKCIQKDSCSCSRGYFGPRCEYSKCLLPCLNGGRCIGQNLCKCSKGYHGAHCQLGKGPQILKSSRQKRKKQKKVWV